MRDPEVVTNERYEYGRLWPDGTFNRMAGYGSERMARKEFEQKSYELKEVPPALRPVFARQLVVTTTAVHPAEALPEGKP